MAKPDITNTELYKKISEILSEEILGNAKSSNATFDPDAKLVEDHGLDDLDGVEYVMILEDTFGISIDDSDASSFKTLRDVYNYLVQKKIPETLTK